MRILELSLPKYISLKFDGQWSLDSLASLIFSVPLSSSTVAFQVSRIIYQWLIFVETFNQMEGRLKFLISSIAVSNPG